MTYLKKTTFDFENEITDIYQKALRNSAKQAFEAGPHEDPKQEAARQRIIERYSAETAEDEVARSYKKIPLHLRDDDFMIDDADDKDTVRLIQMVGAIIGCVLLTLVGVWLVLK